MKKILKKIIPENLIGFIRETANATKKNNKSIKDTFTEIYHKNYWKSKDSISGTGSDLQQTNVLRQALPELLRTYNIKSILDIPCGDFNWMKETDLSGISYVGGDIVEELIIKDKTNFGTEDRIFKVLDLTSDDLPKSDLIFCRDCLVHLSFENINKAIANIKASKSKYFLVTSFTERKSNAEIITGQWRPLNLLKPPFNFPTPLLTLNENCTEENGKFNDKSMCLWEIDKINLQATTTK